MLICLILFFIRWLQVLVGVIIGVGRFMYILCIILVILNFWLNVCNVLYRLCSFQLVQVIGQFVVSVGNVWFSGVLQLYSFLKVISLVISVFYLFLVMFIENRNSIEYRLVFFIVMSWFYRNLFSIVVGMFSLFMLLFIVRFGVSRVILIGLISMQLLIRFLKLCQCVFGCRYYFLCLVISGVGVLFLFRLCLILVGCYILNYQLLCLRLLWMCSIVWWKVIVLLCIFCISEWLVLFFIIFEVMLQVVIIL